MSLVPEFVLEEAASRFALLGDPTRLRIVSILRDRGECTVGELAQASGGSGANVSQHLGRLAAGGIVRRRRVGRTVRYWIADGTIERLCTIVCDSVAERARVLHAPGSASSGGVRS
jgi:DNA-binding transcriptional ArsR family regulator